MWRMDAPRQQSARGSEKASRPVAGDPKDPWAFITWSSTPHLHALSTAGWGRRASLLAVAGFLAFLFNFLGVNLWIPGLHSYAGV